jgi:hypothetical protein
MAQDHTVVLHTYPTEAEAKMIQDKLAEHGIPSFLNDENVMGLDPIGGVELKIFTKDKVAAERVLVE